MELVLIRHSITDANIRHTYCGVTDTPLCNEGYELIEKLKERYVYPDASGYKLYTTGLIRTEQTLAALFGEREHTVLTDMQEMNFGVFEGYSYNELKENEEYIAWISGDNEKNLCPGGESGEIMTARVIKALESLVEKDEDSILVSHGGPIAAIMAHLFPGEGKNRYEWQPSGASGYRVEFTDGKATGWSSVPVKQDC